MKKSDRIMQFIKDTLTYHELLNAVQLGRNPGIDAMRIQNELGIVRNNASTLLNQLWKEKRLVKINSRPVTFLPHSLIATLQNESLKNKTILTLAELNAALATVSLEQKGDPFLRLLGHTGSLANQIGQSKAAIVYPPKGLHTLILGESGVGKTTFADAMHAYGMVIKHQTPETYPLVTFNCADYFNNPQLLLSQLFGHVKNAFTGADRDKAGLVERANGGILFLDEIHRLPPDGQEMLFHLMDKGEYSRLGETGAKRNSNLLIIGATTESPDKALLATFIRRIPVTITLPSFSEKPISEKVEIIDHFFYIEALNLSKQIILTPDVLKALAIFPFKIGNIGQLRSEIKLLCAKAFLQHLQNNQTITIEFSMLSKDIREGLFDYAKQDPATKNYLNMFSENVIISPSQDLNPYPFEMKNDIYELISHQMDDLKRQGLSNDNINEALKNQVEEYFCSIMKNFHSARPNIDTLYKLIPREIVDATSELIEFAQHYLVTKFNNKFIFGLSFHIQALLKRIEEGRSVPNPHLSKIKRENPKEFQLARELVKTLSEKFGVVIPEDEKGFLALLLAHNRLEAPNGDKIGIIVVCHGDTTATSMANVARLLLNTEWIKAIDMPLNATISETYSKVKSTAMAIHRGKGIILLVDMGSLLQFEEQLMTDTGIKVKTIDQVSTPLILEVLRSVLYKQDDLDTLFHTLTNQKTAALTPAKKMQTALLSVCITGQGSSLIAKNILEELIKSRYKEEVKVVAVDYLNAQKQLSDLQQHYQVVAAVGNINPGLSIPYFSINKLLDTAYQEQLFQLLDSSLQGLAIPAATSKTVYETAKDMLEKYVKYVNPKLAVVNIKKCLSKLPYIPDNQDLLLDLIVHMGCMLDRCLHKDAVVFENMHSFIKENQPEFEQTRQVLDSLAKEYDTVINNDEVCYIVKIIKCHV